MFLRRKIKASSIAEIVVALAVIAICFGVASLVFIRSTSTTSRFLDVKKQTEIQSEILEKMYLDDTKNIKETKLELENTLDQDEQNDSLMILNFLSADDKIVWTQHVFLQK